MYCLLKEFVEFSDVLVLISHTDTIQIFQTLYEKYLLREVSLIRDSHKYVK